MAKYYKQGIILISIFCGIILICLTGMYLGRNGILKHFANKRIRAVEQKYGLTIHYDQLQLQGLKEIKLQGLSIVPSGRDTLLSLHSVQVDLSLWKLLRKHIEIQKVKADGMNLFFTKKGTEANYDFLFRKEKAGKTEHTVCTDYARRVNELSDLLYGLLPANGELKRLRITERKDSNFVTILVPEFAIKENRFCSGIEVREDTLVQQWMTDGELNRNSNTLRAELYAPDGKQIILPYIHRRFEASVTLDTLSFSLTKEKRPDGEISLTGKAQVSGLTLFHKALSPEIIDLDKGKLDYRIHVASTSMEVDSITNVQFNQLQFHPYLKVAREKGRWHFTAAVNKSWFPAKELFGSLPKGLFSNLDGIETNGNLAYHFLIDVDFAQLDSLKIESELKEKDFRIVKYGATDLGKMSEEFEYTAYENGQPVRTFAVGPSWEHFTPLDSISPLLQMSLQQSEDGAFYYHRGFLPDALREALIYDLKVKRFARGGSTITMQLVKNVFLNRNKNIARKLEEAMIVWLIENQRLTSKERMYEVYLNIAEWGPMIYGIHEAADYYFNKRPSGLTAEESIFLASIIPKPKHFRNSFTQDMKLKENMEGYYRLITERLLKKGLIDEAEADTIRPDIEIKGKARRDLQGGTVPADSLTVIE